MYTCVNVLKETIIGSMYVEETIMEERKNWNMVEKNQRELTHVEFQRELTHTGAFLEV